MSFGSTAYESFVRILVESGKRPLPMWAALPHHRRLAWEAAAQAVAMVVLPESLNPDPLDENDEENLTEDLGIPNPQHATLPDERLHHEVFQSFFNETSPWRSRH